WPVASDGSDGRKSFWLIMLHPCGTNISIRSEVPKPSGRKSPSGVAPSPEDPQPASTAAARTAPKPAALRFTAVLPALSGAILAQRPILEQRHLAAVLDGEQRRLGL